MLGKEDLWDVQNANNVKIVTVETLNKINGRKLEYFEMIGIHISVKYKIIYSYIRSLVLIKNVSMVSIFCNFL